MKKVVSALLATLSLLPAASQAATFSGQLSFLYPMANGTVALAFTGSAPGCSTASGSIFYAYLAPGQNGVTADGFKNLYSAILMAFAAERTLDVTYDNSTLYCYVNNLIVR